MDINLRAPPGFGEAELKKMAAAVGCSVRPVFVGKGKMPRYELNPLGAKAGKALINGAQHHEPEEE